MPKGKSKYLTAIYDELVKEWPGAPDEITLDKCTLDGVLGHITFLHEEYAFYKDEYNNLAELLGDFDLEDGIEDLNELWQLVLNLGSEFDVSAGERPNPLWIDPRGMIRTLEVLIRMLRNARRSNSAA